MDEVFYTNPMSNETYGFDRDAYNSYGGKEFNKFRLFYIVFHGYLALVVCLFGIIANILNMIVLTRKEMVSPTNAILTGLAFADMLVMVSYVPYAYHDFIMYNYNEAEKFTKGWIIYALVHSNVTVVFHTISIWLTVILAIWRYVAVSFPTESKAWCNMSRAKYAIVFAYVSCPFFCLPVYFTFTINKKYPEIPGDNLYLVEFSEIALKHNELLKKVSFWIYSVLTKLIPCVMLTYLSLALIRVLYQANERKQRLKNYNNNLGATSSDQASVPSTSNHSIICSNSHRCDRTTKMLLAILLLFLITEIPSGVINLLSGILGEPFIQSVYLNLAEFMDFMALVNSGINFILYCTMSRQFRQTFKELFFCSGHQLDRQLGVSNRRRTSASAGEHFTYQTTCV